MTDQSYRAGELINKPGKMKQFNNQEQPDDSMTLLAEMFMG
jgi:hypothetical protein